MVEIVHSSLLKNANLKLHRRCWQEPPLPFSSPWAAEGWLGNPEAARFQVPELEAGSSAPGLTVMYVRAPQCQSDAGQEQKSERCIKCSRRNDELKNEKADFPVCPVVFPRLTHLLNARFLPPPKYIILV